jgi:hypothetical protein
MQPLLSGPSTTLAFPARGRRRSGDAGLMWCVGWPGGCQMIHPGGQPGLSAGGRHVQCAGVG